MSKKSRKASEWAFFGSCTGSVGIPMDKFRGMVISRSASASRYFLATHSMLCSVPQIFLDLKVLSESYPMNTCMTGFRKMTETLANGYSSESPQRELSNEYQHDRVCVVFKNLCILVLLTNVASALQDG